MLKLLTTITLLFFFLIGNAQVETIPKDFKTPTSIDNKTLGGLDDKEHKIFNNINHPLSIFGGALTLSGAALYIIGSERLGKQPIDAPYIESYSPQSPMQFIGIGAFLAGATLFVIFSTEREKGPKRKKNKTYNASEWEAPN